MAWQIHALVNNKTDSALFPRKDALAFSATFHNFDIAETGYIISQSLPQLHMIAEGKVHILLLRLFPKATCLLGVS